MLAAACPFQIQTLCGAAASCSDSGKEMAGENKICPAEFTCTLDEAFNASAGSFTVCFTANVAGSYSTNWPDEPSTQRRFVCATEGRASRIRLSASCNPLRMNRFISAPPPATPQNSHAPANGILAARLSCNLPALPRKCSPQTSADSGRTAETNSTAPAP